MVKKAKVAKLKPSARDKRRYFKAKAPHAKIEAAILSYIGTLGLAQAAYQKVNSKDFPGYSIGSCRAKKLDHVRAALALHHITIEKVGGTLKALKE